MTPAKILYVYTVFSQRQIVKLPDFIPPTLAELRTWWRDHQGEGDIQRLILEVQHLRLVLLRLRGEADAAVQLAKAVDRDLITRDSPIMELRIRLAQEVLRAGEIDDTPRHDRVPRNVREYARNPEAVAYETEGRQRRRERG
jgi:hypothetical protein